MERLVAFLIAFGAVDAKEDLSKLSEKEASLLIQKNDLEKEYIIWGAEGDDF